MEDPVLFPYTPRGEQKELIQFIRSSVAERKHAVIESGTGTGKTICSLTGVLEDQAYHGFKVVYLTRTKSQQKQVMTEMRQINKRRKVFAVALQGRTPTTCPMMAKDPELSHGTPDELSKWCSEYKRKKGNGCPYFDAIEKLDKDRFIGEMRETLQNPEDFQKKCLDMGLCPYEMGKLAVPFANVVCAPYPFMLTTWARRAFLDWLGVPLNEVVIITDEAHNIPDYLRDIQSSEYSLRALDYVEKEALEWGNETLHDNITITDVVSAMRTAFREALDEYLREDDGLVPPFFLEESLMSSLRATSFNLLKVFKNMVDIGENIAEKKKEMHKLPRSYIRSLGMFLNAWMGADDISYVKLINGGDAPTLEVYCMDPYEAAEPFRSCRSSIHMSGTLEPLEHYNEELGLDANLRNFISPFDPNNLLTLYSEDVTTKHEELMRDPDMIGTLEERTIDTIKAVVRNTAVFFSSYSMMDRFISDGVPELLDRDIYYERREMGQAELMETVDNFRTSEGSVLFAVAGGRVSEGLDFPSKDLELVIIVGIPYPYPTVKLTSLVRYGDYRFGNGWEHAVKAPTTRKMRQARGRLIRSETDRGVCVVLDRRIGGLGGFDAAPSDHITLAVREFFGE